MKQIVKQIIRLLIVVGSVATIVVEIRDLKQQKKSKHKPYGIYEKYLKRPIDFMLSTVSLIVLSPMFLVVTALVRIKLGNPVFFRQNRPGKDEKIFTLVKYRTMSDDRDENGVLLSDEKRLTSFGQILRSTSIDELPEVWNIVKGDMAIVGPRPLLIEYLPKYSKEQKHRHDVRPGLTGLAQVSGRNAISWQERFEDDCKYVKKITLLGDIKIIFMTIKQVVKMDGIHSKTSATMEKFLGNKVEKKWNN